MNASTQKGFRNFTVVFSNRDVILKSNDGIILHLEGGGNQKRHVNCVVVKNGPFFNLDDTLK